jgi:hypothetical protein
VVVHRRKGGNERAHAGRDPHRGVENVVEKERGGGAETGQRAEVLLRHDVRPAAVRVGGDGLAVGEVEDRQQDEDDDGEGPHVHQPRRAEGDEDRQRRLGAVRRRRQRIEPEHRHPARGADLHVFGFIGG